MYGKPYNHHAHLDYLTLQCDVLFYPVCLSQV